MKMMFPRICHLIGEQRLIHNITCNNYTYTIGSGYKTCKARRRRIFLRNRGTVLQKCVSKTYNIMVFFCCKGTLKSKKIAFGESKSSSINSI